MSLASCQRAFGRLLPQLTPKPFLSLFTPSNVNVVLGQQRRRQDLRQCPVPGKYILYWLMPWKLLYLQHALVRIAYITLIQALCRSFCHGSTGS